MIKPIKTDDQYQTVLARIYELMQGEIDKGSAASDELEGLSVLANNYEKAHYPIPLANQPVKFDTTGS